MTTPTHAALPSARDASVRQLLPADLATADDWTNELEATICSLIGNAAGSMALADFLDTVGVGSETALPPEGQAWLIRSWGTPEAVWDAWQLSNNWAEVVQLPSLSDVMATWAMPDGQVDLGAVEFWMAEHGSVAEAIRFATLLGGACHVRQWQLQPETDWIAVIMTPAVVECAADECLAAWQQIETEQVSGGAAALWPRSWARECLGLTIGARGRLAADVRERYQVLVE